MIHSSQLTFKTPTDSDNSVLLGIITEDSESDWKPIYCVDCESVLGLLETSPSAGVRLFKHEISNTPLNLLYQNIFRKDTLETFCVSRMLSSSVAHSCYRYVICDYEANNKAVIQIIVFGWHSFIFSNTHTLEAREMEPVVKIQYRECEDDYNRVIEWYFDEGKVEKLILWRKQIKELFAILEHRNQLMPPPFQTFNQMKLSFLYCNKIA